MILDQVQGAALMEFIAAMQACNAACEAGDGLIDQNLYRRAAKAAVKCEAMGLDLDLRPAPGEEEKLERFLKMMVEERSTA